MAMIQYYYMLMQFSSSINKKERKFLRNYFLIITFPASYAFFLIVVDCPSNLLVSFSSVRKSIAPELPLSP